jgi:predicted RNA binding protein YcfA (HicA-like mRNA interferase family)
VIPRDIVFLPPSAVTRFAKLLERLLSGEADRAYAFDDLCTVLLRLGFTRRVRGSHHIFTREGIRDILNLQPHRGGEAKPYQVRQVRDMVVRYGLAIQLSLDEGADDEA